MALKSLNITVFILALLAQPVISMADIASSANYTLEIQDFTGTAGDSSSPSYKVTAITDENFEAAADDYNLCGGLPEEAFGECGEPPPPPPPPDDDDGGSNEAIEYPEEPEPEEIPDETTPQIITFPEEEIEPVPEEPEPPEESAQPLRPSAPATPSPVYTPRPALPTGHWINEIPDEAIYPYKPSAYEPEKVNPGIYTGDGCYGDPKELLRPAAPESAVYFNHRMINCLLAIILLIIAILLLRYAFYLIDEEESKPEAKLRIWLHKIKKKFFKMLRRK